MPRLDVGRQVGRGDARHVGRDHLRKGLPRRLAQRIEDRAVEQRRAIGRDQRIEAKLGAARDLLAVGAGVEAERRVEAARHVVVDGELQRLAELVEILGVGEVRALLEPLGAQRLGGDALAGAAVLQRDAHADDRLDALRHRDDAEAERQAQAEVALEAVDRLNLHFHALCSSRPWT